MKMKPDPPWQFVDNGNRSLKKVDAPFLEIYKMERQLFLWRSRRLQF